MESNQSSVTVQKVYDIERNISALKTFIHTIVTNMNRDYLPKQPGHYDSAHMTALGIGTIMCSKIDEAYKLMDVSGRHVDWIMKDLSKYLPETIDKHLKEIKDLVHKLKNNNLDNFQTTEICSKIDIILKQLYLLRQSAQGLNIYLVGHSA